MSDGSRFDLQMINAMLSQLSEVTERRAAENRRATREQQLRTQATRSSSSDEPLRTLSLKDDYLLVVAFDFGTTFSGYAFSFKKDQTEIRMNKNWGASLGFNSYKTATCLLLDPEKKFVAFGYEAQSQYAQLLGDTAKKYYFFEQFKMTLHSSKALSSSTPVFSSDGKSLPAMDVFSASLKYLKNHCLEAIKKATAEDVHLQYIRWVLTVPAIWSDASKQFMRQAAKQAGFIDTEDSGQLVIALEPEAASLYCRGLTLDSFATMVNQKKEQPNLPPGTKYLVLDAGGGTLDVTCHQMQSDGTVKELHFATGGAMGGSRVNQGYADLLSNIFGSKFVEQFKKESAVEWLNMMSQFEMKKRSVHNDEHSLNMGISFDFGTKYMNFSNKSVDAAFQPCAVKGVTFSNGNICISSPVARGLFDKIIRDIVEHVNNLMKNPLLKDAKYFFMVGGFSDCSLLRAAIFREFAKRVRILVPNEAVMAVVKGAVMFGHHPSAISSRISALTYGVRSATAFDKSKHDRRKMTSVKGREMIENAFSVYIRKGDEVKDGFTKTESFSPLHAEQDAANVVILTSSNRDVLYADEPSVEKHGVIEVTWPGKGKDRSLEISMTFGGTEMHVEAVAYPGGDRAACNVRFLTT